jgi:hypothetical protein
VFCLERERPTVRITRSKEANRIIVLEERVRRNTPPSSVKETGILDSSLNQVEMFSVAETIRCHIGWTKGYCLNRVEKFRVAETIETQTVLIIILVSTKLRCSG